MLACLHMQGKCHNCHKNGIPVLHSASVTLSVLILLSILHNTMVSQTNTFTRKLFSWVLACLDYSFLKSRLSSFYSKIHTWPKTDTSVQKQVVLDFAHPNYVKNAILMLFCTEQIE